MRIITKADQGYGAFNQGQIIENKPIGFPRDGGSVQPYSNLFYWARAEALMDSTIGRHPHQGFEILSFVLKGTIRHFDTKLNGWKDLAAGDVQIIRAGSGIEHAEKMHKGAVIFQIWFDPDLQKTLAQDATYNDYTSGQFPRETTENQEVTTFIGDNSPLRPDTPGIRAVKAHYHGAQVHGSVPADAVWSLYILSGSAMLNDRAIGKDDFVILDRSEPFHLVPEAGGIELFRISSPAKPGYKTYRELMQAQFAGN